MKLNMIKQYNALEAMSVKELLNEWPKYCEKSPKNKSNKKYLISEIVYRMQEMIYGGLTKQTIDRLEALASSKMVDERFYDTSRLAIGTKLVREVKGVEHQVTVVADGYEYQGVKYKSLSGVAYAITGTRWNGNLFFGLAKKEARPYQRDRRVI